MNTLAALRIRTGTLAALTQATAYAYLIVNAWDYNDPKVVAARAAGVKTLVYKDIMGSRADNSGGLYSVGVPFSQADPNESWFIHKAGVRQQFSSFPGVYVMNVGNAGYQAAWLSNVLNECTANGWQGVWADDCNIDPQFEATQPYDEYATQASWQAAQRAWLAAVGPSFLSAGKLIIPNFQHRGITADGVIFSDWLQFVSGFNIEWYTKWTTGSTGQHLTPEWDNVDQDLLQRANAASKVFIGIVYAPKADSRSQLYARASFLIDWDGVQPSAVCFEPTDPEAQDPSTAAFNQDVGSPTGARVATVSGWRRAYSTGDVTVDTTGGTGTITGRLAVTTGRARKRISLLGAVIALAVIGGGGYGVSRLASGGVVTANVWIAPNATANNAGSNCTWHSTPVVNPDPTGATLCSSPAKAYQFAAQNASTGGCGGTAMMLTSSTYARQDIFYNNTGGSLVCTGQQCRLAITGYWWSSSQDLTGCFTFKSPDGSKVVFSAGGSATTSALNVEVPNTRWVNIGAPRQASGYGPYDYLRVGDNISRTNVTCTTFNVHDTIFDTIDFPEVIDHAASYTYFTNFTIGHKFGIPLDGNSHISGCNNLSTIDDNDHSVFLNGTFRDLHAVSWANPGAPALVQSGINETSSGTSVAKTFTATPTLGNTIVATISSGNAAGTLSCSMDGTAMTLVKSGAVGSGGAAIFETHPVGSNSAAGVVTCSTTGSATYMSIVIDELVRVSLYPFGQDKTSSATGTAVTTLASTSITPTLPGNCNNLHDIVVAAVGKSGTSAFGTWGSSYTADQAGNHVATATTVVASAAATSTSQTWGSAEDAAALMVDFKCAVANHLTGLHWDAGNYGIVRNVTWTNNGDYGFEPENANAAPNDIQYLEITNNVFGPQCADTSNPYDSNPTFCTQSAGGALPLLCHVSGAKFGPVLVRTSSFDGSTALSGEHATGCDNNGGGAGGVTFVGIIAAGAANSTACTNWQSSGASTSAFNWTFQYPLFFSGVNCGTGSSLVSGVGSIYTNPAYSTLDYTEQSGAPSIGFVPSGQPCPDADYNGVANSGGCDAGAYKR